jgi:hypothetical protein
MAGPFVTVAGTICAPPIFISSTAGSLAALSMD